MKFMAILGDSFREAFDTKVFTVLVGLSIMLTLLAASASFEPEPVEAILQPVGRALNGEDPWPSPRPRRAEPAAPRTHYQVRSAEPVGGGRGTPSSSYRVVLAVTFPDGAQARAVTASPEPFLAEVRQRFGLLEDQRVFQAHDVRLLSGTGGAQGMPVSERQVVCELTAEPTHEALLWWPHQSSALFGAVPMRSVRPLPLGAQVWIIENYLVNGVAAWTTVLLGIVVTAFFIPNMLRKGAVDLLLVRPLHRVRLLLFKYLSAVVFMAVNVTGLVFAIWVVLGLRTGIWYSGFLLSILAITFFFAILFALSALVGLGTRSPVVAILITCVVWFGLWLVGTLHAAIDKTRDYRDWPEWVYPTIDTLHTILPRTKDLDLLMARVLRNSLLPEGLWPEFGVQNLSAIAWGESLAVSAAFVGGLLGLTCWRFYRRDY